MNIRLLVSSILLFLVHVAIASGTPAPPSATTPPAGTPYIYKRVAGEDLKVWVVSPKGHTAADRSPALVFFHGGGWRAGPPKQFDRQASYLIGRGIVGIEVYYRPADLALPVPIAPCIEDAKSSMRWVRGHAGELGIDPARIGAVGGSAGGQLAAFLGTMNSGFDDPQDNLSVSPNPDLLILFNPAIDLGPALSCCGDLAGKNYRLVSPFYHAHPGVPPTLILQGAADKTVSPAMIQQFAAELKQDGVRCDLVLYPGVGHAFFNMGNEFYETLERADVFLASVGWISGEPDEAAIHRLPNKAAVSPSVRPVAAGKS